jgi:hypothetical protein
VFQVTENFSTPHLGSEEQVAFSHIRQFKRTNYAIEVTSPDPDGVNETNLRDFLKRCALINVLKI